MQTHTAFKLVVSKVSELIFSGDAHSVTLPGSEGELTILPHHEPLITKLKAGTITIRTSDGDRLITIEKGLLETSHAQVTVLI